MADYSKISTSDLVQQLQQFDQQIKIAQEASDNSKINEIIRNRNPVAIELAKRWGAEGNSRTKGTPFDKWTQGQLGQNATTIDQNGIVNMPSQRDPTLPPNRNRVQPLSGQSIIDQIVTMYIEASTSGAQLTADSPPNAIGSVLTKYQGLLKLIMAIPPEQNTAIREGVKTKLAIGGVH